MIIKQLQNKAKYYKYHKRDKWSIMGINNICLKDQEKSHEGILKEK